MATETETHHVLMPNDQRYICGVLSTIVASCYVPGTDTDEMLGLVLYPTAPYFGLITADDLGITWVGERHANIVPVMREYEDMGGDY